MLDESTASAKVGMFKDKYIKEISIVRIESAKGRVIGEKVGG